MTLAVGSVVVAKVKKHCLSCTDRKKKQVAKRQKEYSFHVGDKDLDPWSWESYPLRDDKNFGERTSLVNFNFNVQLVGCSKSLEEPFLTGGCVLSYKISGVWIPSR